jgi:hypothetical protein
VWSPNFKEKSSQFKKEHKINPKIIAIQNGPLAVTQKSSQFKN